MTSRTHDLAAFTALSISVTFLDLQNITIATILFALLANFFGGLAPDLDKPTATLWKHVRGGGLLGRLLSPLLGGHRLISHSILGVIFFAYIADFLLTLASPVILVDMNIAWWAFMIGLCSHLIMDMLTKEGIPLFFPFGIKVGFPPIKKLRITTGSFVEKGIIFPLLIFANFYIFYNYYGMFLNLFN